MRLNGILVMTLLLAVSVHAQNQLPTMADIKQDYETQKYQDVIRKVAQVINLKGASAASFDKHILLLYRAEANLHLKQLSPAAEAFAAAARETTDEKKAGTYKATVTLIKRSPGGMYTPRQPSTQPESRGAKLPPISIIDQRSRKDAMAALFNDELKIALPKIDAMGRSQSIPPLMNGIKQVGELRELEVAATGSDPQTKKLLGEIAGRAGELMSSAVKQMDENVQRISDVANRTFQSTVTLPTGVTQLMTTRQGLNSNDIATLNDVEDTCRNIAAACEAIGQSAKSGPLEGVESAATKLANQAEQMLKTDYAGGAAPVMAPVMPMPSGAPTPTPRPSPARGGY